MGIRLQTRAFFLAIALAVFFHFFILFFVKDLKINSNPMGKAFIENQSPRQIEAPPQMTQQEIHDRQEQLAEVLNQIVLSQLSEPKFEDETFEHIPQISKTSLDPMEPDFSVLDEPSPVSEGESISDYHLQPPLLAVTHSLGEEAQSSQFLRRPTALEILFPNDEYLVDELILATEMAQGRLAPEVYEDVAVQNAIKAGAEEASLNGNSMKNRSGILDKNLADIVMGSGGSFNLSSEIGNWNYTTLRSSLNFQSREALLPPSNKNELRGFDYKSLGAVAGSNDFNLNIEYSPRKEGGYLFRLELVPKKDVKFKHIKQNFFFLIDRSHSIRFNRYEITKVAVAKALALLQKGDTFNILVFHDSITRLSGENLLWNAANVNLARDFIQQQEYGGLFANTDLYSSLGMIVPSIVPENEVNTAILLSDGDTFLSSDKQRKSIGNWTEKNAGKVSLYAIASGKGNNLALLDILSLFNKGALHYSPTDKGIENVLFSLIQSIRNPIGKDITMTTIPSSQDLTITLYPRSQFLANLYENTPYVVYGVINKLKDFHIFFQGKYYDKLLDIKQEVSFKEAKKTEAEVLEKKIAMQKAYIAYRDYLYDGQSTHLNEIKQLLSPYRIPIAFK
jgi:hypothetical protein